MKRTNTFSHYRMNLRSGMFSFVTHRITGLILVLAGIVILLGLSAIMLGKETFEGLLIFLRFPFFSVMAHILVIVLYWHVLNGIKILVIDLFRLGRIHKILTWISLLIFLLGIIIYFINVHPVLFK